MCHWEKQLVNKVTYNTTDVMIRLSNRQSVVNLKKHHSEKFGNAPETNKKIKPVNLL